MKKAMRFLLVIFMATSMNMYSQITTTNNNVNLTGYASSVGKDNQSLGIVSQTYGFDNVAEGHYSTAIGSYLMANALNSIIIGNGFSTYNKLVNNRGSSLMVGFDSDVPTFFVTGSGGIGKTGKVGIGNVGFPEAKLHLRADDGEEATFFIQPYSWTTSVNATIKLGDNSHQIATDGTIGMVFTTPLDRNFAFLFGKVGIGTIEPRYNLHVEGSLFTKEFTLIDEHNQPRDGFVLVSDDEGNGLWTDPVRFGQWKINPNNGVDLYFPEGVEGNVGIGTINTYGYRLAVNGKILTDEVMVKDPIDWFDYVLKPEYELMPLYELEIFINNNYHLPDVPSEAEVKKDGYGLAEMNGILLKKVEELTLYIIEQQKAIDTQKADIDNMKELIGL